VSALLYLHVLFWQSPEIGFVLRCVPHGFGFDSLTESEAASEGSGRPKKKGKNEGTSVATILREEFKTAASDLTAITFEESEYYKATTEQAKQETKVSKVQLLRSCRDDVVAQIEATKQRIFERSQGNRPQDTAEDDADDQECLLKLRAQKSKLLAQLADFPIS
jgi:hypothetical protein